MNKNYFNITILLFGLHTGLQAQVWLGIYGIGSKTAETLRPESGGGFGFSLMSREQSTAKANANARLKVQYGMNFYWSTLGHRSFHNVPLASPQNGLSKVTLNNSFFGLNALARLSFTGKSRFTPYGEAFLGYRGTFTSMTIDPYQRNYGYEEETDKTLASVGGINYGLGGGLTADLTKSKRIKLDLGVSYIEQIGGGRYGDLATASAGQNGINLAMKPAPMGIVMFNLGLLFYIEDGDDDRSDDDCHCRCGGRRASTWFSTGSGWSGGRANHVNVNIGGTIK
jgi:hypothetical protein